ncbi:hypothetical protein [Methylomonas albis]|uniref:DUF4199 domain-containing protein n=2 Tax=Methylomonas albis TaxID=1854563 RepID=A0ABR9CWD3_9GAMM|nr:hypothetical protein [Methylomonas albis]MBD9355184.1 hypothetical protein [Methylomonas albis]
MNRNFAKCIAALIIDFSCLCALVYILYRCHGGQYSTEFWITLLLSLFGILIGWLTVYLATPKRQHEVVNFPKYANLIYSGVTGYFLAKLEPTLNHIFENSGLINNVFYGVRFLGFVSATIIGAIGMYVFRVYLGESTKKTDSENSIHIPETTGTASLRQVPEKK